MEGQLDAGLLPVRAAVTAEAGRQPDVALPPVGADENAEAGGQPDVVLPPETAEAGRLDVGLLPVSATGAAETGEQQDVALQAVGDNEPAAAGGRLHVRNTTQLKKGDHVEFRGKEEDDEWYQCELISRAGRATGKYSCAWNILRDGVIENIDFERDAGAYEVLSCTEEDSPSEDSSEEDMQAHLMNLLQAAENRELDRDEHAV
jgi:hypothetical protein